MMLAYVESVLVGILTEADDFLLEFLMSMLSRSHQVISKRVLGTCASRIPLQQILSSIDAMMHNKENEGHNGQPQVEIIESDACNGATLDEECRKGTSECKLVPTTKDIQFWYPEVKHEQMPMPEGMNFDMFIPKELLVAKKLHPLIEFLLFQEKLYKL